MQGPWLLLLSTTFSDGFVTSGSSAVVQSCPSLCHSMDCGPPGSSVHGVLQARILEWVAMPSSGDLPGPGIESRSPALQVDSLPSELPGKPQNTGVVAYPFTRGSSPRRNQILLHCRQVLYQLSYQGILKGT